MREDERNRPVLPYCHGVGGDLPVSLADSNVCLGGRYDHVVLVANRTGKGAGLSVGCGRRLLVWRRSTPEETKRKGWEYYQSNRAGGNLSATALDFDINCNS